MTWFTLAMFFAISPYHTEKILVNLNCTPRGAVYLVVDGIDYPWVMKKEENGQYSKSFKRARRIDQWKTASLRVNGHRTDCKEPGPESDDNGAIFTFHCDENPADNVQVAIEPKDNKVPLPDVHYVRRLDRTNSKSFDCVESEDVNGTRTIYNVRRRGEKLILSFGATGRDASGVHIEGFLLAKAQGPNVWKGDDLPAKLAQDRTVSMGYLSPISIDLDREVLKAVKSLTIMVVKSEDK